MTYGADTADARTADVVNITAGAGSSRAQPAKAGDDISSHLSASQIAEIGLAVCSDWERDLASNKDWREKAEKALNAAAQEKPEVKTYPWKGAANVQYPLLTISAVQFQARAYPAIVKDDQAIKMKVLGPDIDGAKAKRAERMGGYLNWKLFYGVDGWEADTDALLLRLPIVGQHFRKVYWDPMEGQCCIESVSALRLTIPANARSLKSSPRITHDFDRYPYELQGMMKAGHYRTVTLIQEGDDEQAHRLILEQHRMMDLDGDGLDEPYICTVDKASSEVLRIEEAFGDDDLKADESGKLVGINRWCPFVDYSFIPDPKGRAYAIGFGHLLSEIMEVVNTNINLMIDAGHAQVAGGGFISQEVRLQGAGQNGSLKMQPGEYKTVNASAAELRNAIYERTFPSPSPILFQLLEMLLGAAKDIASVNDVITGDAARTAPVGTTLALIEQGQQVFNAIYKRVYRSLRDEFKLFVDCVRKYGDPQEYARFIDEPDPQMGHNGGPALDDQGAQPAGMVPAQPQGQPGLIQAPVAAAPQLSPEAMFKADFEDESLDVRPVSDPAAATRMQVMARDQFALSFVGHAVYADDRLVVRQALTDAGVEQAEAWIPDQAPVPPPSNPMAIQMAALEAQLKEAQANHANAQGELASAKAKLITHENTGPQADVKLAAQVAKAHLDTANAAATAAGLIPNLEAGGGPEAVAPAMPPSLP